MQISVGIASIVKDAPPSRLRVEHVALVGRTHGQVAESHYMTILRPLAERVGLDFEVCSLGSSLRTSFVRCRPPAVAFPQPACTGSSSPHDGPAQLGRHGSGSAPRCVKLPPALQRRPLVWKAVPPVRPRPFRR